MIAWVENHFPRLAKHWTILRVAWVSQSAADAQRRPQTDHEFLPAALEIVERPPSRGLRALLWMICAFFTLALGWSIIGTVDMVAVASGKIIPTSKVKTIQPLEIGSVRSIHVANGQHVEAGQLLVELDPTLAMADEAQARASWIGSRVIEARNGAILAHLDAGTMAFSPPDGVEASTAAAEAQLVRASIAEFESQLASLRQQIAQRAAELTSAEAEIAKLRLTLPLVEQQLEARRELTRQGNFAQLRLLEYEQQRIEHIQNIDVQLANAQRARASMTAIEADIRKLHESFRRTAMTDLLQARDKSKLAAEDLRKTMRRREFLQIRAPISGTVQQLGVTTIGGVVQPAQPLMVIVPDGAELEVEAHVLNKDIGFVREGQPVQVKLEAFPFTEYGLVPGRVDSISRDAIDLAAAGGAQRDDKPHAGQPGLVYAARIRLLQTSIQIRGRPQELGPGLSVQAEIKTGERRIIQYLLAPITQSLAEAGRER